MRQRERYFVPSIPLGRRGATNAIIRPSIYSLYVNLFMGVNRAVRVTRKKGGERRLLQHADTCFQCVVKRFFFRSSFSPFFPSLSREGDDGYMANLLRSSYRCESERSIIVRNLNMREGVDKEKKKKARQRFRLIYSINLNFS